MMINIYYLRKYRWEEIPQKNCKDKLSNAISA